MRLCLERDAAPASSRPAEVLAGGSMTQQGRGRMAKSGDQKSGQKPRRPGTPTPRRATIKRSAGNSGPVDTTPALAKESCLFGDCGTSVAGGQRRLPTLDHTDPAVRQVGHSGYVEREDAHRDRVITI